MSAVNSVDKAARILTRLSRGGAANVGTIADELQIPLSTTYKILASLEQHGLVERSPAHGYRLGYRLIEFGHRAQQSDLLAVVHPLIADLSRKTGETVHFTRLDDLQVLYLDSVESTHRLRTASIIGERAPLHSTAVGKAVLAFAPTGTLERLLERPLKKVTDSTITSTSELRAELATVRERGYAIDDRENESGIRCVGVPVRSPDGVARASLSISGPAERITKIREKELAADALATAASVSDRVGKLLG